ncbi:MULTISPECIES: outer membrane protein assembly factor BamA [Methylobacterium]|jgi:outer membrane protein insertion porin family|uniref:outer membrane protein assembly factor BamA n=1 Tax=Methylobacterium TaxID=407 RepID=UPI0008F1E028|nr:MULTISPECIES: outer membrane protein assembly factor BamA [Methylobacterium]MBZ6412211.1 outer membrane protein assembly factor BamA [Methylobacterium sp.]MBK3397050.1 outer membrane protein assembly factor BamA [Methylobacterium ajmalii]MBK3410436.1 outer membrane protein assembly factor BamA [Methylobacterium ajmalii]MBK3424211.1 outer membrane protein assembly factor BamA [Methylobacterium ajmalii]SFE74856.1 Beta-barrel assembly machine subunit BamA [Methylobacterium sp. yr596]
MMSMTGKRRRASAKGAIVMAATIAASGSAFAQQIVVQGNSRIDPDTVRSYVVGVSPEEGRRNLIASGMFSDVRVSHSGGRIVVSVRENNTINRVFFEGNKKVEKATLEGIVESKSRGPYSQAQVNSDLERIREVYRRAGRGSAKVSVRTVDLPNGRVDVVYTVDEGDKTGIKEIKFVGNQAYSDGRLKDLMTLSEMNLLSFVKTSDVYDPDRLANDLDLIRRYYLKNGYADFRIASADSRYDDAAGGWIVTITVEEGQQYRVGAVSVDSRIPGVDGTVLRDELRTGVGDVYNAEDVEKTLTGVTTSVARSGHPFAQVRPTGERDRATGTVALGYIVEDGPKVYIERINVRGNTRTRDYVVRRELDLTEGDAYNRVLVDRAERRLNGLGFFKKVRFSNEPGSAPDRVVVNIDVEDQPTGSFSVAGGYSTADGIIGEVSVSESNFLGRGQYVRLAGTAGQYTRGVDFSFTEPYFLGYRLAAGFDVFNKYSDQTRYSRYVTDVVGGQLRLGLPITEEFGITLRYSIYNTDLKIPNTLKRPYNDCSFGIPGYTKLNPAGTIYNGRDVGGLPAYPNCAYDGEASIALKEAVGSTLTSLAGVTLAYSTLDNLQLPRNGFYGELKPEYAGIGGDSKFFRVTGEARYYKELYEDVVGFVKFQGGHVQPTEGNSLRVTDQFFLGPSLVRGFAPNGIGPRDVGSGDARSNAIGGTTYVGASVEVQFPIWGLPRDLGLKGAVFADAGTLFGYKGRRSFDVNGDGFINGFSPTGGCNFSATAITVEPECVNVRDKATIRSSVGASILWNSPLGPIRFDYAYALSKDEGQKVFGSDGTYFGKVGKDQTQAFRFSGGSRF